MNTQPQRRRLQLIPGTLDTQPTWSWFCSRCAAVPERPSASPLARACSSCGIGVLRETRADALPPTGAAFLIVDAELRVESLSRRAEMLLGERAAAVIDRPVARLLAGADAEARGSGALIDALRAVSTDSEEVHSLFVRPSGSFGVRMAARIAACGPPRAALIVLRDDPPGGGELPRAC